MNDFIAKIKAYWTDPAIASGDLDNALLAATARKDIATLLDAFERLEAEKDALWAAANLVHDSMRKVERQYFTCQTELNVRDLLQWQKTLEPSLAGKTQSEQYYDRHPHQIRR